MIFAAVETDQAKALRAEMKQAANIKWYRRLKIIELSGQGHSVPELTRMFDLSAGTIRRYIHAFNANGLEGLRPQYGQGRPLTLDWSKAQWLDVLAQSPGDLDKIETDAQNWNQSLLQQYLARYHQIEVSQPTISKALRRVGLRWRRAKRRVHSPDPLYVVKRQRVAHLRQLALTDSLTSRPMGNKRATNAHLINF